MKQSLNKQLLSTNAKSLTSRILFRALYPLLIGSTLTIALSSLAAGDNNIEDLNNIRQVAERYALQQIDRTGLSRIKANTKIMDARLRLTKCTQPLNASMTSKPRNISRVTVSVRCNGKKPWNLYVPVTVTALTNVVYTAMPLVRGAVIQGGDLEIKQMPIGQLPPNYLHNIHDLTGMELIRSVKSGVVLTLNNIKIRQLIQRDQEVIIVAKGNKIQVRMNGKALKNASIGDTIPVLNIKSGQTIKATVVDRNTVLVNM